MAKGSDVLRMLRPEGGWAITGDSFEGITWLEAKPLTKQEFEAGFETVDAWLLEKENAAKAKRQALLDKLGITEAEARLLLG
jgi:hypothetical protein